MHEGGLLAGPNNKGKNFMVIEHRSAPTGGDAGGVSVFGPGASGSRSGRTDGSRPRGRASAKGVWQSRIVGHADVAPTELKANPRNWRRHSPKQLRAIAGVLSQVGWVQQVIVNVQTGHLVDGHARVEEAISRHEPTVPVVFVDLTADEERLVIASFDPLGAMASSDTYQLEQLLGQLGHVDDGALRRMLGDLALRNGLRRPGHVDPDELPALPDEDPGRAKMGEIWALGAHLLAIGDATDPELIGRLVEAMEDARAECLWTDMPFGVDYTGKTADRLAIANDDPTMSIAVLAGALRLAPVMPSARFYLVAPSNRLQAAVLRTLAKAGWRLHQQLVWLKDRIVPGHSDYQEQHETILYGYAPGAGRPSRGRHAGSRWYGGNEASSVLAFPRPARNPNHPTQKPVALVEACLANSTQPGDWVFDPLAGSGTTILAAERLARRCAAVELDPRYATVAIERWETFTGQKAVRRG